MLGALAISGKKETELAKYLHHYLLGKGSGPVLLHTAKSGTFLEEVVCSCVTVHQQYRYNGKNKKKAKKAEWRFN
jgi:hypothetical protein